MPLPLPTSLSPLLTGVRDGSSFSAVNQNQNPNRSGRGGGRYQDSHYGSPDYSNDNRSRRLRSSPPVEGAAISVRNDGTQPLGGGEAAKSNPMSIAAMMDEGPLLQ